MSAIKCIVCPNCGRKVSGRFVRMECGVLGLYQVFKFYCVTDEGRSDYVFCCFFERRFRISQE